MKAKPAEYDALAAKNISKDTIRTGRKLLGTLKDAIAQNRNLFSKPGDGSTEETTQKTTNSEVIPKLISEYYNYVPHFLDVNNMMLLNTSEGVSKELSMLDNLEAIRASASLAHNINLTAEGHDDTLKKHFKSLGLKTIHVGMLLLIHY